ncbi:MAG: corA [Moraxellaceae bacterium]|jgi:magnesium transporter|nr:corA [Moraxellaceae bacterium]
MSVVNCGVYHRESGRKLADIPLDQVSEALDADAQHFVWVGLHEPDAVEMKLVRDEFCLHELAIEDATRPQHRSKIEAYGDTLFVVLRTARLQGEDICMGHTSVFIGPRYVLTVRQGASLSYAPVRQRCEQQPEMMKLGPAYVLYALLDFVVDNFYPVMEGLSDHLRSIEHDIFGSTFKRKTVRHLYDLKQELVGMKLAVAPLQDVCGYLLRSGERFMPPVLFPYLRDINDHVLRINDVVNAQSEMVKVAMDVNMAMVTVAQNDVVKRLASWAAILALPTMIASFYGMNFEVMPELKWPFGYPLAMAVMLGGSVFLWRRLKKAGWL